MNEWIAVALIVSFYVAFSLVVLELLEAIVRKWENRRR
jgi:hypothetical protein